MTTTETPDTTTSEPPADETTEPVSTDVDVEPDGQADDEQEQTPNQEAAKYRRRLREVEAERDRLATQVEAFRRGEVERMVGPALGDPADLWVGGITLDELVDDEGAIDAEEVEAAVAKVLAAHPSWAPKFPDLGQGARGGGAGGSITWADALSVNGRGGGRP